MPYKQMAAETMRKGHLGDMSFLIGQTLKTKVLVVRPLTLWNSFSSSSVGR